MLLLAIFQLQEEEDDEIREDSDLKTAGKYCQFLISFLLLLFCDHFRHEKRCKSCQV